MPVASCWAGLGRCVTVCVAYGERGPGTGALPGVDADPLLRDRDVGGLPGQADHGAGRGRAVRGLHRRHPHRTLRLRLRWVQRQQQRGGGWSQSSQSGPPRGEVDIYLQDYKLCCEAQGKGKLKTNTYKLALLWGEAQLCLPYVCL